LVFPVKYRKVLLDEIVVKMIEETTEGIQENFAIEMEGLGMDRIIFIFSIAHISKWNQVKSCEYL
jgi:hypothetical protein